MERAVSVIICTRNRAESLRDTLASIGRCDVPADMPTEVLVVDNGSTDHTREVVQAAKTWRTEIRYIFEAQPGQVRARNRGIRESGGEIIVFTDDDLRFDGAWLQKLVTPILARRAEATVGRIVFPPDRELPWLRFTHRSWLASTERCSAGEPELVGANMAVRRDAVQFEPCFDSRLGPGALGFGDDRLLSLRLQSSGCRIEYVHDAVAEHHFDISRLTRGNFLDMADRMGRSEAYLAYHWFGTESSWCGSARPRRLRSKIRCKLNLLKLRMLTWLGRQRVSESELLFVAGESFRSQFLVERKAPRRYALDVVEKVA